MIDVPVGRKLEGSPARKGYLGEMRPMPKATGEAIKYAARQWPQGRADEFDRDGRTWTDRATGVVYKLVHGSPLQGDDEDAADLFVVEDDVIWFLRRADRPQAKSVTVGTLWGDA